MGTPEKIRAVAARVGALHRQGEQVCVVVSAMGDTTDDLISLARQVSPRSHPREMDMLLTAGERVSMALLSMALSDCGAEAISFTGSQAGIITDESHSRARILEIRPHRVERALSQGKVAIVAGFQGVSRGGEITTLGRGGSDTSSVALAIALGASRCEVFTDVNGIYSADPRIVSSAKRYSALSHELVLEMAVRGAQVMHARSIEIARAHQVSLFVGQAHPEWNLKREEVGTMIECSERSSAAKAIESKRVVAVTSRKGLVPLRLSSKDGSEFLTRAGQGGWLHHGIQVGLDGALVAWLDLQETPEAQSYKGATPTESLSTSYAAISVVGENLQQDTEIVAEILRALGGLKVVSLTTQTRSITVFLEESEEKQALQSLHKRFLG